MISENIFRKGREKYFQEGIFFFLFTGIVGIYIIHNHLVMNDAYWHIKIGEYINENGFVHKCVGSWVLKEESWLAQEWLFEWLIYKISQISMNAIIYVYDVVYFMIIAFCTCQMGIYSNRYHLLHKIVLFIQFVSIALVMSVRPQYIVAIIIAAYLLILNKSLKNEHLLYFLPAITILWSNIHGGSSMLAYLMILVYLVCNLFELNVGCICFKRAEKKWILHCTVVFFLTVIAIMINPYGYKMLLYPYISMRDSTMVSMVSEWAAPDAKNLIILAFQILPVLLGIVILVQHKGNKRAQDVAIFFMFLILYLRSARFIVFLVVAQMCLIGKYGVNLSFQFTLRKKKVRKISHEDVYNRICMVGCYAACIVLLIYQFATVSFEKIEINKELPDELMQMILADQPERLFNHYNAGGYLLYHDVEVFVDGRYDPYNQKGVITDFFQLILPSSMEEYHEFQSIIEKYDFDAFLIYDKNVVLANYLSERMGQYELKYDDGTWLYYRTIKTK